MAGALWVLTLLDEVTRPAGYIDRALGRLENRAQAVERGLSRLSSRASSLNSAFRATSLAGESSAQRISRAWDGVQGSIQGAQQGMNSLLTSAAQLTALGAAVGYGGKKVLDLAGMREMQLTQVETALNERDPIKVKAAVQWINKFADETPFTDQQTMTAVRQTLGWGFKWNEMQGITRILGDATTMNASDPADASYRLNRAIRAIGQIRSKGVLQAEEVNQLQENIPGISAILDREFGPARKDMQRKGQITANMAIGAILKGLAEGNTAGGMQRMSQTLFGLTSTLASRPQRIIGMLYDNGSLDPVKQFLRNLISLTDFTRQPGKRAVDQLAGGGKRLISAIFGPLNRATSGRDAERLIDELVRQLDTLTLWFERNGPALRDGAKGFGEGFKAAADGASLLLAPVRALQGTLTWFDEQRGGSGEAGGGGLIGRILGFGVGAAVLYRIGNWLSFGMLGRLGGKAGQALLGGLARARAEGGILKALGQSRVGMAIRGVARGLGQRFLGTWGATTFARSVAQMGLFRALGLHTAAGWGASARLLGGMVTTGARALPVIGWIITGLTAVKGIGDALYNRFDGFADLMDKLRSKMSWLFDRPEDQTTALGKVLNFDLVRWATGQAQVWESPTGNPNGGPAPDRFMTDATATASRLGIRSEDLLGLLNLRSALDPKYRDKDKGMFGLLGLTDDLARQAGTTAEKFGRMSRENQLQVIERLLSNRGVREGMNLKQVISALYAGDAGQENLWLHGTEDYRRNASYDTNNDLVITASEVAAAVQAKWNGSAAAKALEIHNHITLNGPANPQAVSDIGTAAANGAAAALSNYGLELGAGVSP